MVIFLRSRGRRWFGAYVDTHCGTEDLDTHCGTYVDTQDCSSAVDDLAGKKPTKLIFLLKMNFLDVVVGSSHNRDY